MISRLTCALPKDTSTCFNHLYFFLWKYYNKNMKSYISITWIWLNWNSGFLCVIIIMLMSITPRVQGSLVGRKLEESSSYHEGMRDPMYILFSLHLKKFSLTHLYVYIYISTIITMEFHSIDANIQIYGPCLVLVQYLKLMQ